MHGCYHGHLYNPAFGGPAPLVCTSTPAAPVILALSESNIKAAVCCSVARTLYASAAVRNRNRGRLRLRAQHQAHLGDARKHHRDARADDDRAAEDLRMQVVARLQVEQRARDGAPDEQPDARDGEVHAHARAEPAHVRREARDGRRRERDERAGEEAV